MQESSLLNLFDALDEVRFLAQPPRFAISLPCAGTSLDPPHISRHSSATLDAAINDSSPAVGGRGWGDVDVTDILQPDRRATRVSRQARQLIRCGPHRVRRRRGARGKQPSLARLQPLYARPLAPKQKRPFVPNRTTIHSVILIPPPYTHTHTYVNMRCALHGTG